MGTQNYNFTYLDANSNIDLVTDTTRFLNEIDNALKVVDNKSHDYMLVIGDSYTASYGSNWAEKVSKQLGLNLVKYATGSMGYVNKVGDKVFEDHLHGQTALTYAARMKYVICYGGINDWQAEEGILQAAVTTFIQSAKTLYPNAQIIIVGPQGSATGWYSKSSEKECVALRKAARAEGVAYADARLWLVQSDYGYSSNYLSDNLHPTSQGFNIIASKMLSLIAGIATDDFIVNDFEAMTDGVSGNIEVMPLGKHAVLITGVMNAHQYSGGNVYNNIADSVDMHRYNPFIRYDRVMAPVFRYNNGVSTSIVGSIVARARDNKVCLSVLIPESAGFNGQISFQLVLPLLRGINVELS